MFFLARTDGAAWGANLEGSPIYAAEGDPEPVTTFFVPVTKWSDGTTAAMERDSPNWLARSLRDPTGCQKFAAAFPLGAVGLLTPHECRN
jgi:hypothetical protein